MVGQSNFGRHDCSITLLQSDSIDTVWSTYLWLGNVIHQSLSSHSYTAVNSFTFALPQMVGGNGGGRQLSHVLRLNTFGIACVGNATA